MRPAMILDSVARVSLARAKQTAIRATGMEVAARAMRMARFAPERKLPQPLPERRRITILSRLSSVPGCYSRMLLPDTVPEELTGFNDQKEVCAQEDNAFALPRWSCALFTRSATH